MKYIMCFIIFLGSVHSEVPWLGITFKENAPVPAEYNHPPHFKALEVVDLLPGSGAPESGLEPGDLILEVQNTKLNGPKALIKAVKAASVGDTLHLLIGRSTKKINVPIVLYPRQENVSKKTGSPIGSKAPSWEDLKFYQGTKPDHKNKILLIDFWATWCGPCKMSFPVLKYAHEQYGDKGMVVMGVSQERLEVLQNFQNKSPLPYVLARDPSGSVNRAFGITAIPTFFVIDENGYILTIEKGVPNRDFIDKIARKYLDL